MKNSKRLVNRLAVTASFLILLAVFWPLLVPSVIPPWVLPGRHKSEPHGTQPDKLVGYWLNEDREARKPVVSLRSDGRLSGGSKSPGYWHASDSRLNLDQESSCGSASNGSCQAIEYELVWLDDQTITITTTDRSLYGGTYSRIDPSDEEFLLEIQELCDSGDSLDRSYGHRIQYALKNIGWHHEAYDRDLQVSN